MSQNPDKNKYEIGVPSDTQDLKGSEQIKRALEPLRKLEQGGVDLDMIVHIGDVGGTGIISKYVREGKGLEVRYDKESQEDKLSEEMEDYKKLINSSEYQEFSKELKIKGVEQDIVIYALWRAKQEKKYQESLEDMRRWVEDVVKQLGEFKSEVKHIVGNADRAIPEKLEAVQTLLKEQNIETYDKPIHLDLDKKKSLVFWPSINVNEKDDKQMQELNNTMDEFAEKMKDKESVLIFAHETPFKGPKKPGVYQTRVEDAGLPGSERVPYKQFLPISKYILELCRRLPAKTKIALTCGHMHAPREIIGVGTQYLKFNEEGKAKLRLFGLDKTINKEKYETIPGQKRTVDLYYLPAGEVGKFEIDDDGNTTYQKLEQ